MITKLFTEINEKMDEVEKILKDNNYFTTLEKRIEEYNNKMMAVYNNEATEYINRVNRAIEYIEKEQTRLASETSNIYQNSLDNYKLVNEDIYNELDRVLDILKGSDKE